jgi:hypothetical protein
MRLTYDSANLIDKLRISSRSVRGVHKINPMNSNAPNEVHGQQHSAVRDVKPPTVGFGIRDDVSIRSLKLVDC